MLATFLGGPAAGAWLVAANFKTLGVPDRARRSLWMGGAATIALLLLAWLLPDRFPDSVLPIATIIAMRTIAERHFGAVLKTHQPDGPPPRTWGKVIGIGVLCLTLLLGFAFGAMFAFYFFQESFGAAH